MSTITVNVLSDTTDGSIFDGTVSLRDALAAAVAGDVITFDSTVFTVDANPLLNQEINLTAGDMVLTESIRIDGDLNDDGIADVTLDALDNPNGPIFRVTSGTEVDFDGLVLKRAENPGGVGGALSVQFGGIARIQNSVFSGNSAFYGGAIGSTGTVYVANTTFQANEAARGGAIDSRGDLTIANSTFIQNYGSDSRFGGGAIASEGSGNNLTLAHSTITGNYTIGFGGGVALLNGSSASVVNSIVAGNQSARSGRDINGTISSKYGNIFSSTVSGADATDLTIGVAAFNTLFETPGAVTVGVRTFDAGLATLNGTPGFVVEIVPTGIADNFGDTSGIIDEDDLGIDVDGDGTIETTNISQDQAGFDRQDNAGTDSGAVQARSTTLLVDVTSDVVDSLRGKGQLSLREAVLMARDGDTIAFDDAVFGADGNALNNTTISVTGVRMTIDDNITINGDVNGDGIADVTLDAGGSGTFFLVETDNATLRSLTMQNAFSSFGAGAVDLQAGSDLSIVNSTVRDSTGNLGGGVLARNSTTLNIVNSTFEGNTSGAGGAIFTDGSLTLLNSTLSGNYASGVFGGGGIFKGNSAGTFEIINSTITGNRAAADGGGVAQGIGTVRIDNSIIAGNSAGGGIRDVEGNASTNGANIFSSAVTGSSGGDVTLSSASSTQLRKVFEDVTFAAVGGVSFARGVLADNGGPTQTVQITVGGYARDGGNAASLPTEASLGVDVDGGGLITNTTVDVDQRLGAREIGQLDIGAVEVSANTLVVTTLNDEDDGDSSADDLSLREALAAVEDGGTITFDPAILNVDGDPLNNSVITMSLGEFRVDKSVTIIGDVNGDGLADVTLDGSLNTTANAGVNRERAFDIVSGTTVLDGLTLTDFYEASSSGGAIASRFNADLVVRNSNFIDNMTGVFGAAIRIYGDALVTGSYFAGNVADRGGAIRTSSNNATHQATILNSTFVRNQAIDAAQGGGAIDFNSGNAALINSTVTGNKALGGGGGVVVARANARLENSIIAGNSADGSGDDVWGSVNAPISNDLNIFGTALVHATETTGDLVLGSGNNFALDDVFATVNASNLGGTGTFDEGVATQTAGSRPVVELQQAAQNPALDRADDAALDEASSGLDLNADGDQTDTITVDGKGGDRSVDLALVGGVNTTDVGAVEADFATGVVIVTTTDDEDDTINTPDDISLREAIRMVADGGTIRFDPTLFTADGDALTNTAINLTLGTIVSIRGRTFTIDGDTNGDGVSDVTISGSGNNGIRMFSLDAESGVDSDINFHALTFAEGTSSGSGAALRVRPGSEATVTNSVFVDNTSGTFGAAIRNYGTTNVANSFFTGNTSTGGGAIRSTGSLAVVNSTFTDNGDTATARGGAVQVTFGTASITNSTFTGNYADDGGGLYVSGGSLSLSNNIVAGNRAAGNGNDAFATPTAALSTNARNVFGEAAYGVGPTGDTVLGPSDLGLVFETISTRTVNGVSFDKGDAGVNGGFVPTVALNVGTTLNPALDAGDADAMDESSIGFDVDGDGQLLTRIVQDARGLNRFVDLDGIGADRPAIYSPTLGTYDVLDIGAFEAQFSTANIVVTTLDDENDSTLDLNDMSLREALALVADGGTITFASGLFPADADPLNNASILLSLGTLTPTGDVTINGDVNGDGIADVTLDGSGHGLLMFALNAGQALTLNGLALGNSATGALSISNTSSAVVTNSVFFGNGGSSNVGGIVSSGDLLVANSFFTNNTGNAAGAIYSTGTTNVVNSTFVGNSSTSTLAFPAGSAINQRFGSLNLVQSTVTGNAAADGSSGAVSTQSGTLRFANNIVAGNAVRDVTGAYSVVPQSTNLVGVGNLDEIFERTGMVTVAGTSFEAGLASNNSGIAPTVGLALIGGTNPALDAGGALSESVIGADLNGDGDMADKVGSDGRGFSRLVDLPGIGGGFSADLGAFEVQSTPTNGADFLSGTGASDSLDGLIGGDSLVGAGGDDTLQGGSGADAINGGGDQDRISGGAGNDTLTGASGNDTINAGNGEDQLFGGTGNDTLRGEGGNDTIEAGSQSDVISGGVGNDTINAGDGHDDILGQGDDDVVRGQSGNDTLRGGVGEDVLYGGVGDDELQGQGDADILYGEGGDDILRGGSRNDVLYGGGDDDELFGQGNNDILYGGAGDDRLTGAAGADSLYGGSGNDALFGGLAGDFMNGGTGNDTLNAGAGLDQFLFELGTGNDTVIGFTDNQDTIRLSSALVGGATTAQQVLDTFAMQVGGSVEFDFMNGRDFIRVTNFTEADLLNDIMIV